MLTRTAQRLYTLGVLRSAYEDALAIYDSIPRFLPDERAEAFDLMMTAAREHNELAKQLNEEIV